MQRIKRNDASIVLGNGTETRVGSEENTFAFAFATPLHQSFHREMQTFHNFLMNTWNGKNATDSWYVYRQ